jgi:hypothetical protein
LLKPKSSTCNPVSDAIDAGIVPWRLICPNVMVMMSVPLQLMPSVQPHGLFLVSVQPVAEPKRLSYRCCQAAD